MGVGGEGNGGISNITEVERDQSEGMMVLDWVVLGARCFDAGPRSQSDLSLPRDAKFLTFADILKLIDILHCCDYHERDVTCDSLHLHSISWDSFLCLKTYSTYDTSD